MISGENFLRLRKMWRVAVLKLWGYKCAFPGCVNKPTVIPLHKYGVLFRLIDPMNGICACPYHRGYVIANTTALLDNHPPHHAGLLKPGTQPQHVGEKQHKILLIESQLNKILNEVSL